MDPFYLNAIILEPMNEIIAQFAQDRIIYYLKENVILIDSTYFSSFLQLQ